MLESESESTILSERLRLKIAPALLKRTDDFGILIGLNRSEVVRIALLFFLNAFEDADPDQVRQLVA